MPHSHGWQVGATFMLVALLGLWARDLSFSLHGPIYNTMLGLPHSMMTGFQEQISQKRKEEMLIISTMCPW